MRELRVLSCNYGMDYDSLFFFLAILPKDWRRYTVPEGLTVIQWIADFSDRVKQLQHVSQVAQTGTTQGLKVSVMHTRITKVSHCS